MRLRRRAQRAVERPCCPRACGTCITSQRLATRAAVVAWRTGRRVKAQAPQLGGSGPTQRQSPHLDTTTHRGAPPRSSRRLREQRAPSRRCSERRAARIAQKKNSPFSASAPAEAPRTCPSAIDRVSGGSRVRSAKIPATPPQPPPSRRRPLTQRHARQCGTVVRCHAVMRCTTRTRTHARAPPCTLCAPPRRQKLACAHTPATRASFYVATSCGRQPL